MRIVPRSLPSVLPDLGDLPPLLTRLYAARGVQSAAELDKALARLIPYRELKGIDAAVELLVTALESRQRMLIVGDFDGDGATASGVGVLALRMLGAAHVDFLVPNRFEYGYGLTPEIVAVALASGAELLITVDNGISSIDGVAAAKAAGHARCWLPTTICRATELPAADAIVNPNQPGCGFPSKSLAGVGVIFYVLLALRARLRRAAGLPAQGLPSRQPGRVARPGGPRHRRRRGGAGRQQPHPGPSGLAADPRRPWRGRGCGRLLEVAGRDGRRITLHRPGLIARAAPQRRRAAGRHDASGIDCLLCEDDHAGALEHGPAAGPASTTSARPSSRACSSEALASSRS